MIRYDNCIYKRVFKSRAIKLNLDIKKYSRNESDSPVFDMLRIAFIFDIYHMVMRMCTNDHMYMVKHSGNQ